LESLAIVSAKENAGLAMGAAFETGFLAAAILSPVATVAFSAIDVPGFFAAEDRLEKNPVGFAATVFLGTADVVAVEFVGTALVNGFLTAPAPATGLTALAVPFTAGFPTAILLAGFASLIPLAARLTPETASGRFVVADDALPGEAVAASDAFAGVSVNCLATESFSVAFLEAKAAFALIFLTQNCVFASPFFW
jgi:hypothetical protein